MSTTPETSVQRGFEDPRSRSDFLREYYPKANGKDAPPEDSPQRNDRIMIEFLAAYYSLNREYGRLRELRKKTDSAERAQQEREHLQAIEKVLIVRDGLEDRYAPLGVIAEPLVNDGFAVDVKFSFGNVDANGRRRSDLFTMTVYVPIPMPAGARLEDLELKIEGPGI